MYFLTLLCLFSVAVLRTVHAAERPLLETKYGKLQGVTLPVRETQRTVDAFFGIPFAKPPVGPLRFKNPEAIEPWISVRDASQYPPVCLQVPKFNEQFALIFKSTFKNPPVSEDCLYLNVFTPSDRHNGLRLPVMVYIHGGGLVFGGASLYDGSALSAYEDVVVVAIQYRVGLLGYLSTGNDQLRGNLGFIDQVSALRWVHENIEAFGGDPNSVTIFGESAGGISVAAHVLSPLSKGLFHRAIAESGTMLMPGLVASKSENLIFFRDMVSHLFGCEPSSVIECLKMKSEEEILAVAANMGFLPLPASVDGVFLPKPAEEIMANKQSNVVPLLLGVCNHDAAWLLLQLLNRSSLSEAKSREAVEQEMLSFHLLELDAIQTPLVLDEYLAGAKDPSELRDGVLDIGGDRSFAIPALSTAKYHRGEATDEEKLLSRTIMRYWANFARNGDPNGPGLAEWPLYDAQEGYLEIGLKQKASARLKEKEFKFWTETLPEKAKRGDRNEL